MKTPPFPGQKTGRGKTTRPASAQPETPQPADTPASPTERRRGKGDIVALTFRLSRTDWERVHQFAVSEGTSIQQLAIKGLSRVFAEKGLPGIER